MHQEGHAVGAEFGIALEHAVAVLRAETQCSERVFRRQLAGAPVRDPERIRPVVLADLQWHLI